MKEIKKQYRIGRIIYVDPEKGSIKPIKATIHKINGNILHTDQGPIQKSWVLYIKEATFKKMKLDTHQIYSSMKKKISQLIEQNLEFTQEEYLKAKDINELASMVAILKYNISPKASSLWIQYQDTIGILMKNGFIDKNEIPSVTGKMAARILSANDPLTMVEFLTNVEYDIDDLVPLLTIFLRQKRNND